MSCNKKSNLDFCTLTTLIHVRYSVPFLHTHIHHLGTPTKQGSNRMSPTLGAGSSSGSSDSFSDRQFIAITSEKTARVIALPSQNCVYRQQIADTDYVVKAEVISLKGTLSHFQYIYSLGGKKKKWNRKLRTKRKFCIENTFPLLLVR